MSPRFIVHVPFTVKLPVMVNRIPLLKVSVPPSMTVTLFTVKLLSNVTVLVVRIWTSSAAVGTPVGSQMAGLLQLPLIRLVLMMADASW